jgi:SAM-dependent methyltransferase
MKPKVQLLPLDVEDLMHEVRSGLGRDMSRQSADAVHFYCGRPQSNGHVSGSREDSFNEVDYLDSNPDTAAAVKRGEFRSGYEHWVTCGEREGRWFEPCEFRETDYLELNPDVVLTIADGSFASGHDHWLRCGRLEGRRVTKALPLLNSRWAKLGSQTRAAVLLIGEAPPNPQTLRGKLGTWAVLAIRRLLWWYTQPIKNFAKITEHSLREHAVATADLRAALESEMAAREALASRLTGFIEEYGQLRRHFEDMQRYGEQTRTEVAFNSARVGMFLEEVRRRLPGPLQPEQLQRLACATEHTMDAVYVAFENAFRGTRELVKERQSIYLSYLATAEAGTPGRPILDIGCGRGEWLELLRENQLTGRGIDSNQVMLDTCRAAGLDVVEGDALSITSALPDASLGALTAFHVVEHLPFDTLAALLDQALRTLKPGGLLILETPNPGNVLVGSHNFYLDPTHLRPLPMAMLRFLVEAKGFGALQILELHPNTEGVLPLASSGDLTTQRFNELFCGPQDYAVIARRP